MALRVLRRAVSNPACHGRYSALSEINGTGRQKVSDHVMAFTDINNDKTRDLLMQKNANFLR